MNRRKKAIADLQRTIAILSSLATRSRAIPKSSGSSPRSRGTKPKHITRDVRENKPANKPFQVAALRRIFSKLNPTVGNDVVDFESYVDPSLHMSENIEVLKRAYPVYRFEAEGVQLID